VTSQELEIGYRGATACSAAGITYRQLDYWARTGLVEPSIRTASGSGTQRLYGFRDILVLKIVKRLLDAGVSLQNIRTAVDHLRSRGVTELESMTLMSDGGSIYEQEAKGYSVSLLEKSGTRLRVLSHCCKARSVVKALVLNLTMNFPFVARAKAHKRSYS